MSGVFPINPRPARILLSPEFVSAVNTAVSGRSFSRELPGHLWKLTLEWPPMTRAEFDPIFAFLMRQRGRAGTFTLIPPDRATPRGLAGGTPVVSGAGQLGSVVATAGWTPNTAVLKAGDLVKFSGHNKVYMVTVDATSDGTGLASLEIEPPLFTSPAHLETLVVTGVPFTVRAVSDAVHGEVTRPLIYGLSLELVEAP